MVHIIKFKVQTSMFKGKRVQTSKFKVQSSKSTRIRAIREIRNFNSHKGYLAFHSPPFGGGEGGGASWVLLLCLLLCLLFCLLFSPFYNKLSPNIAFLISFSCSNTKRATMALSRAVEGSFTLVADFRRSRTPLRSESM